MRGELRGWFARPVERRTPPRDDLAIKLVTAVGMAGVDVRAVVEAQRRHVSRAPEHPDEVARLLVLEQFVCHPEAELRGSTSPSAARLLRFTQAREPNE